VTSLRQRDFVYGFYLLHASNSENGDSENILVNKNLVKAHFADLVKVETKK